jgi:small GTP-binding protein
MQPQIARVVMIGESAVGKTSLVYRLCEGTWNATTRPTVSTAFYLLKSESPDGEEQSLQIWDTAGAERYRALNSVYYHNAMGGILVFDLLSRDSFDSLDSWFEEFTGLAQPGAIVAIVGNKVDLIREREPAVRPDEAEKFAKARGLRYFSTSAQDGTGVAELAKYMLAVVPQRHVAWMPTVELAGAKTAQQRGCCG